MATLKGRKQTPEHIEKRRQANLGKKRSLETRQRISLARIRCGTSWNKGLLQSGMSGKHHSEETKAKMSKWQKGIPKLYMRGENHHVWKGGLTQRNLREIEYIIWRSDVFGRDDYTCQICNKRGMKLEAHHIKRWQDSPELRYSPPNGITLCRHCHNKTKGHEREFEEVFLNELLTFTRS